MGWAGGLGEAIGGALFLLRGIIIVVLLGTFSQKWELDGGFMAVKAGGRGGKCIEMMWC